MKRKLIPFLKTLYFHSLEESDYRANLSIFKNLTEWNFEKRITYFVGENGSWKSTFLEAIALAVGFNAEWWSLNARFSTTQTDKNSHWLSVSWQPIRYDFWYFLRAESVYGMVNYLETPDEDGQIIGFRFYGNKNLHTLSHWQQFLAILEACVDIPGIYIFDEIESALSPANQLRVKFLIEKMALNGSQFIIATHSPIILSIPNTQILTFDYGKIMETEYSFASCVDIYKRFFSGKI